MSRGQASVRAVTFSRPPVVWGLAVYTTFSRVIVDSFPKLFGAHTRLKRLRLSDNTRSVKAKQLDDGIGDTLVAVRATSGVYKRARLRCGNYIVSRWTRQQTAVLYAGALDSVVTGIST